MTYYTEISSPLGRMTASSDGAAVTGLWFADQKYFGSCLTPEAIRRESLPVFDALRRWLAEYFGGAVPGIMPELRPDGTAFRQRVWEKLRIIPRGSMTTYGRIAEELGKDGFHTSARAVGGAVGHNPISILIPCHRVVGSDGSLIGYAGGLERKRVLLKLEGLDPSRLTKSGI